MREIMCARKKDNHLAQFNSVYLFPQSIDRRSCYFLKSQFMTDELMFVSSLSYVKVLSCIM